MSQKKLAKSRKNNEIKDNEIKISTLNERNKKKYRKNNTTDTDLDNSNKKKDLNLKNNSNSESDQNYISGSVSAIYRNGKVYAEPGPLTDTLFSKNYFGTRTANDKPLELEPIEALILLERARLDLVDEKGTKVIGAKIIKEQQALEPQFWNHYLVYRDLRQRGYIVRPGYGEGIHFRLFPRGAQRDEAAAKYFVVVLPEDDPLQLKQLEIIAEQAIRTRKTLILAIVDHLSEITYYQMEQISLRINNKKPIDWPK